MKNRFPIFIIFLLATILLTANESNNSTEEIANYLKKAEKCEKDSIMQCIGYLEESFSLAQEIKNDSLMVKTIFSLSKVLRTNQRYDEAIAHLKKIEPFMVKKGSIFEKAKYFGELGLFYYYIVDYEKSLENFHKALLYAQKIDDRDLIIEYYIGLGNVFFLTNQTDKMEEIVSKITEYGKRIDNSFLYAKSMANIAAWYLKSRDWEKAELNLAKAIDIAEKENLKIIASACYQNMGIVLSGKGDVNQAIYYYNKALKVKEEINDKKGITILTHNIGNYYYRIKNYKKANQYLIKAINLAEEIGDLRTEAKAYLSLAKSTASQKKYQNAIDSYEKYIDLTSKWYNEDFQEKLASLEAEYGATEAKRKVEILEKEKKIQDLEIQTHKNIAYGVALIILVIFISGYIIMRYRYKRNEILRSKNTELEKINIELSKSKKHLQEVIASKDRFFQIIGHDLKNPLSILLNSSELLKNSFLELTSDRKIYYLGVIHGKIINIISLLDNLLNWAASQAGKLKYSPTNFDIIQLLKRNVKSAFDAYHEKGITVKYDDQASVIVNADRNMVDTVVRNLLSNAIKFTVLNGEIQINVFEAIDFIQIDIQDNGVGMNEEKLANLFKVDKQNSTLGTANEKGNGLGLILCKEFVEKNKGELLVESEVGKGSTFSFKLNKKNKGGKPPRFPYPTFSQPDKIPL